MSRALLIDTDPGVDDALAVLLAARSPELEIVGLTTVFGNAAVEVTTRNALALLELIGRSDVPVFMGAAAPLVGTYLGPVTQVHGHDGMGDGGALPTPRASPTPDVTAAEFIVQSARERPGTLTILALGPLTNLALALALEPDLARRIEAVVLMGGNAVVPGNATPAAEANMLGDPEAADRVLGADWPVTMVGLDVTHQVNLRGAQLDQMARVGGPVGTIASRALPQYRSFFESTNGIDGIYLHDPTVVGHLLWPELFGVSDWPMRVETVGISRGKTWPNTGGTDEAEPIAWQGRPRVAVCTSVDGAELAARVAHQLLEPCICPASPPRRSGDSFRS
jgi:purine nucleosidase